MSVFNWIKLSSLLRAEQKLSRQTERERDVCVRAEQKLSRQTKREREREREVCARAGKQDLALARQYQRFSETK